MQLRNDFQLVLDLLVRPRRPLGRSVPVAGARHHQVPQPAVLGVPVRDVERRQLRGDQRQLEGALLAEFGRGRHHLGTMREQPRHLLTRPQMRTTQRRKVTGRLVDRVAGPDRAHGHRQPPARRLGEMGGGGGDDADTEPRRQLGQRGVALVVERMPVVGELDADPVAPEPVHQIGKRLVRRFRAAVGKRLADMAFAASGQDVPVPAGRLGQRVEVVAQLALSRRRPDAPSPAGATAVDTPPGRGQAPADAARADRAPRCGRRHRGTARRRTPSHVEFLGGFGESHHPVEPVVIGQRDGAQIEPGGLLDEFLRRAGAVEEAVRRMRVQLGIRDRRGRAAATSSG